MTKRELDGGNLEAYEDMKEWFNSNKKQYKCAQIAIAIDARSEPNRIIALSVLFLNTPSLKKSSIIYTEIQFFKIYKSVNEGWEFIETLIKDNIIEFNGHSIIIEGDFRNTKRERTDFNSSKMSHITSWPGRGFAYQIQNTGSYPSGPLVKIGTKIYSSSSKAVTEWVGKTWGDRYYEPFEYDVCFIFPDYRTRIKILKLYGEDIKIEIENQLIECKDIILKYYFEGEEEEKDDGEVNLTKPEFTKSLTFVPTIFYIYLFDKTSGIKMDWREINLRYDRDYDIQIERSAETIEYLLDLGEGSQLEYKSQFNHSSEFHETIVAFANTKGGRILIGVEDSGTVKGIKGEPDGLIKRIEDSIANSVEPTLPGIEMMPIEIHGEVIVLIVVPEGDDKPYMLTKGGTIYIRARSSDKPARKSEVDSIYDKKYRNIQSRY